MNLNLVTKLLVVLLFIGSLPCPAQRVNKKWVGYTDEQQLASEFEWFRQGYASYSPDSADVKQLSTALVPYTLLVFGGVWCGDTKRLLPKFYKTLDQAGISHDKVKLYLVNEKKRSHEKLEKNYTIKWVPVFIILKDGKEVGRITEKTEVSIEADLFNLIK